MNTKLFLAIFSVFLLIPSFSYAYSGRINPCPPDIDGDGRYGEIELIGRDAVADGGDGDNINPEAEVCNLCNVFELANNVTVYIMTFLAPVIAAVMLILGGFYFMMAGVDPGKLQKGKEIMWATIIGLIIIFAAWVILNTFLSSMGVAQWTGLQNWWEFKCN